MRKQFLSTVFVTFALLFSAWGNVIAAAFCPRFALHQDCCLRSGARQAKQVKRDSPRQDEMTGMDMDDMQMESDTSEQNSTVPLPAESTAEQAALDSPMPPCTHCLSHSQTTFGTASVAEIELSKRVVQTNSLPANFAIALTTAFADLIAPSEHSPPGPSPARHVIINVFRI